jgi:hypothetical protein
LSQPNLALFIGDERLYAFNKWIMAGRILIKFAMDVPRGNIPNSYFLISYIFFHQRVACSKSSGGTIMTPLLVIGHQAIIDSLD